MKAIDAEYYGYRDEDDGVLEPLEQEHEKEGMRDHLMYIIKQQFLALRLAGVCLVSHRFW